MLIGIKGIASGQPSIPDSCICYTDDQDKRCLECLINQPKYQELIENLQEQISKYDEIVENDSALLRSKDVQISMLVAETGKLQRKVKRGKLLTAGAGILAGVFGVLWLIK